MKIELREVHFAYLEEGAETLRGLSAAFDPADITVLTGPSGCGKSTLLYLAAGIYPHHAGILRSGEILVDEVNPAELPASVRCRRVGMMFQNPDLQFCMDTVRNELIFCLENIGTEPADFEEKMTEALRFCEIPHLRHRRLDTLSGGEKQRVMLACQIAIAPSWLLLDEPFANVDDEAAAAIIRKLEELHRDRGIGILAVDHRLENWLPVVTKIRTMEEGVLRPEVLATSDIPAGPDPYVAPEAGDLPERESAAVLELRDVSLSYQKRPAEEDYVLRRLSQTFRAGRRYAIVGGSGSGKSTLFGALFGLHRYEGKILLEGEDLEKVRKKSFGKIGFVTQNPQDQFIGGTVREEILSALSSYSREDQLRISEEILRNIRLWRYRDISPYMLSQGQQRRLGVAALMAYPCRVLLCDEPTYAQDRANTVAIMESLTREVREKGVALIFSTHDRQLARDYADQILKLEGGELHAIAESLL